MPKVKDLERLYYRKRYYFKQVNLLLGLGYSLKLI